MQIRLPRVLVVDDLFGRRIHGGRNEERADLCGHLLLRDVTGDEARRNPEPEIRHASAEAVFIRGQRPAAASIGDIVENDIASVLETATEGYVSADGERCPWALILLDLCFYTGRVSPESSRSSAGVPEGRSSDDNPDGYFGLTILDELAREAPDIPVVILSSKPRGLVSREFARRGALAFIARDAEDGAKVLREYLDRYGLLPDPTGRIVGNSISLLLALRSARRAAKHRRNILIRGERGTGKELLAAYIHAATNEQAPLVAVDSGALSSALFASELFGHRRGSFTDAHADRVGRIVQSDGGDLFLDEIGNMPAEVQVGLLRVVESRIVVPIGSVAGQSVDVRFLSATNEDIESKAEVGLFRADLLDRLREAGTVILPTLRSRKQDLPALARHFVRWSESKVPGAMRRSIDASVTDQLASQDWPGNLRELRDTLYAAVASHPDVEHLVFRHLTTERRGRSSAAGIDSIGSVECLSNWDPIVLSAAELGHEYRKLTLEVESVQARALLAAILATCRVETADGSPRVLLAPAVRLLTGNPDLSPTQACDFVKRNLTESAAARHPLLQTALETARRLRPTRRRPKPADSN